MIRFLLCILLLVIVFFAFWNLIDHAAQYMGVEVDLYAFFEMELK